MPSFGQEFTQGLQGGLQLGIGMAERRADRELKDKIARLQELRAAQNIEIEKQKATREQQQQAITNSLNYFDRFMKGGLSLSPEKQQSYYAGINEMPFVKQAPPELRPLMDSIAQSGTESAKDYTKIISEGLNAAKNKDQNGLVQSILALNAMGADNKAIGGAVNLLKDLAGIPQKPSELATAIEESKQYAPGTPEAQLYDQLKQKITTQAKSGGTTVNINPMGATKETLNFLQRRFYDIDNTLANMEQAAEALNPDVFKYLGPGGTWKGGWQEAKRVFGWDKNEAENQAFDAYNRFKSLYSQGLAQQIHELYGTALTRTEAEQAKKQFGVLPAGITDIDKWLDSDAGRTFLNKFGAHLEFLRNARSRYLRSLQEGGEIKVDESGKPMGFYDTSGKALSVFSTPSSKKATPTEASAQPSREDIASKIQQAHPDWTQDQINQATLQFGQSKGWW